MLAISYWLPTHFTIITSQLLFLIYSHIFQKYKNGYYTYLFIFIKLYMKNILVQNILNINIKSCKKTRKLQKETQLNLTFIII